MKSSESSKSRFRQLMSGMIDPSEISGGTVEELEKDASLGMVAEVQEEYNKR